MEGAHEGPQISIKAWQSHIRDSMPTLIVTAFTIRHLLVELMMAEIRSHIRTILWVTYSRNWIYSGLQAPFQHISYHPLEEARNKDLLPNTLVVWINSPFRDLTYSLSSSGPTEKNDHFFPRYFFFFKVALSFERFKRLQIILPRWRSFEATESRAVPRNRRQVF